MAIMSKLPFKNEIEGSVAIVENSARDTVVDSKLAITDTEEATNIVVGRLIGGAFPCIVDRETIKCETPETRGGLTNLVNKGLDRKYIPTIVREWTVGFVKAVVDPLWDGLVGGTEEIVEVDSSDSDTMSANTDMGTKFNPGYETGPSDSTSTTQEPEPTPESATEAPDA